MGARAAVVLGMAVFAFTAAPARAAEKPGTFAGSLGAKVPKGAEAAVRAVDRSTSAVAGVREVGRNGKFSLALPPGTYLVVGTVIPARGKPVEKRSAVSLKPGQKRKNSSLTARKRKRKAKRNGGRAAFVQEHGEVTPGQLAVAIPVVTGNPNDAEWDARKGGLDDIILTDIFKTATGCGMRVVESARKGDLIKELEFQQSPYVDPTTAQKRNFFVEDIQLQGVISPGVGGPNLEISIIDAATGKSLGSRKTALAGNDWMAPLEAINKALAEDICKLSDLYTVKLNANGDGRFATHSATGVIDTTLRARRSGDEHVWRATGPLQWGSVTFATKTDCPYIDILTPAIEWSVIITDVGDGNLQVTWTGSGNDSPTASVDCPPDPPNDPPPIPGQPGPSLINTGPQTFLVPYAGGFQPIAGGFSDGGDGFFNTGVITVERGGIG
jgi:hypothetical protein